MAEIIQEEKGKKGGKRRPKKHSTRIDMTPMVDLMCLLITFFMLTTAFSKPKVMVITMPEKNKKDEVKDAPKIPKERTLNILLTEGNKVYYYNGLADPKTPPLPVLIKTDFSKDGLRKILLGRNKDLFTTIANFHDSITMEKVKIYLYIDDSLKPVFARTGSKIYRSNDKGASWTSIPVPQITDNDIAIANLLLKESAKTEFNIAINGYKKKLIRREASISEINPIVDAETKSRKREDMKPRGTGPFVLIKADDKVKYRDIVNIIDEMAICNIAGYAVVDISPVELEMLKNAPK
jgi:biopolymer transport protein ExbD